LARHPKTAATVKREGIARAILADWPDAVDKMLEEGFDIDGIWIKEIEEPFTPLYAAIEKKNVKNIEFLLQRGAKLNVPVKDGFHLPTPLVIALRKLSPDAGVIEFLINYNEQRKLPIPWDIVATTLHEFPKRKHNGVLLHYLKA